MESFERITIRLKPYEKKLFIKLMDILRDRAGYEIPATDVVKSLMGFKTKLSIVGHKERALLAGDLAPTGDIDNRRRIANLEITPGDNIAIAPAKRKAIRKKH